jgi:hypothetical protein
VHFVDAGAGWGYVNDRSGRALPSGVYLARIVTAAGSHGEKLVLVR